MERARELSEERARICDVISWGKNGHMSVTLSVGPIVMDVSSRPEPELLAVFRDDMFRRGRVAAASTGNAEEGQEPEAPAQPVGEFRAPGRVISARLDLMLSLIHI